MGGLQRLRQSGRGYSMLMKARIQTRHGQRQPSSNLVYWRVDADRLIDLYVITGIGQKNGAWTPTPCILSHWPPAPPQYVCSVLHLIFCVVQTDLIKIAQKDSQLTAEVNTSHRTGDSVTVMSTLSLTASMYHHPVCSTLVPWRCGWNRSEIQRVNRSLSPTRIQPTSGGTRTVSCMLRFRFG